MGKARGACLVVIHGLGGTSEGHYVLDAAAAADRQQMACLRLDLRGAGSGGATNVTGGVLNLN
jgi:predicted alpha/beta-fold hydrolase